LANELPNLKIASSALSAEIAVVGAELQKLSDGDGQRLQWDGDPTVWDGRAPILFPIVGMLNDGVYHLDGRTWPMPKHGFARRATFEVAATDGRSATLRLDADEATRALYPFEFRLEIAYALDDVGLTAAATVWNRGETRMPASFGFHPALRWPLPYGQPRDGHTIVFEHDEPAPIRRIDADGLLTTERHPTPVEGRILKLRDADFDDDALIFDALASRRVDYGGASGPRIGVSFDDVHALGIWTKPGGAHFICIEPWHGIADPVGFDGDIRDKPGIVVLAPGEARTFRMWIALVT